MDDFPVRELEPNEFPPLLREITDPPKKLYARGAVVPWDDRALLTVVGSRHYSLYGKEAVRTLINDLRGYPVTIISGLAIGMDGLAHEAALEAGLTTIAVPGSGIDDSVLYPRRHKGLAREILARGGMLLSEFEPETPAALWTFPKRNRIMAGMAHATLIVEASEKSGTLITARLAMEYNRDVLTIPGSIFATNSFGPHMLIRDGATPITSASDILEALHIKEKDSTPVKLEVDETEMALLLLLESPLSRDELIRAVGKPAHETSIALSMLELKGYIRENAGVIMRIVNIVI